MYYNSGGLKRHKSIGIPGIPETQNAIYLARSLLDALFYAIRRGSVGDDSKINHKKRIVYFEGLDKFDPEAEISINVVDPSVIPLEPKGGEYKIRLYSDEYQLIINMDEIKPLRVETHKAGEFFQYFKLIKDKGEFLRLKSS